MNEDKKAKLLLLHPKLSNYLWFLEADVENIELSFRDYMICLNGIWKDGTWKSGHWKNGRWLDGFWEDGFWNDGIWERGVWGKGNWVNGTWGYGTWENGMWKDGIWYDGKWKGGHIWNPKISGYEYSKVSPNECKWSLSYKKD
ncbi:MAG: hypothetical protein ACOC3V_03280 [bacterium]